MLCGLNKEDLRFLKCCDGKFKCLAPNVDNSGICGKPFQSHPAVGSGFMADIQCCRLSKVDLRSAAGGRDDVINKCFRCIQDDVGDNSRLCNAFYGEHIESTKDVDVGFLDGGAPLTPRLRAEAYILCSLNVVAETGQIFLSEGVGTGFSVSHTILHSCDHNLTKFQSVNLDTPCYMAITRLLYRDNEDRKIIHGSMDRDFVRKSAVVTHHEDTFRIVRRVSSHAVDDWALFELVEGTFDNFFRYCPRSLLPSNNTPSALRIYHSPISAFSHHNVSSIVTRPTSWIPVQAVGLREIQYSPLDLMRGSSGGALLLWTCDGFFVPSWHREVRNNVVRMSTNAAEAEESDEQHYKSLEDVVDPGKIMREKKEFLVMECLEAHFNLRTNKKASSSTVTTATTSRLYCPPPVKGAPRVKLQSELKTLTEERKAEEKRIADSEQRAVDHSLKLRRSGRFTDESSALDLLQQGGKKLKLHEGEDASASDSITHSQVRTAFDHLTDEIGSGIAVGRLVCDCESLLGALTALGFTVSDNNIAAPEATDV